MKRFLKLLIIAVFALPISAASAENYSQYVSIGLPEATIQRLQAEGIDPQDYMVTEQERADVERALAELISTPEGLAVIQEAASNSTSGRVHIYGSGGTHAALGGDGDALVGIGTEDNTSYYTSPDTHQFHPLTMQRVLFHELTHLQDEGLHRHAEHGGQSMGEESRAVYATNLFMERYYGEPPRTLDYGNQSLFGVSGGGDSFPLSSAFNGQLANTTGSSGFQLPIFDLNPIGSGTGTTPTNGGGVTSGNAIDSILNRYLSLGGDVDSRRSTASGIGTAGQIQPFSFTRDLANLGVAGTRYQNANGDYSGERYRSGGGMGGGFSLARSAGDVRNGRGGGLLQDAFDGDGTFMGQQTGNLFQGNLNLSGFNVNQAISGGTTSSSGTTGTSVTRTPTSSGGTTTSYPNYAPPSNSSSGAPPSAIGTGPR